MIFYKLLDGSRDESADFDAAVLQKRCKDILYCKGEASDNPDRIFVDIVLPQAAVNKRLKASIDKGLDVRMAIMCNNEWAETPEPSRRRACGMIDIGHYCRIVQPWKLSVKFSRNFLRDKAFDIIRDKEFPDI